MTHECDSNPITIGIDFGGDALRVATDVTGPPSVLASPSCPSRLRRVIQFRDVRDAAKPGWKVVSLKRLLDLDGVIHSEVSSIGDAGVVDYVAQLLKGVIKTKDFNGTEDRGIRVLGSVPDCFSQRQRSMMRTVLAEAGFAEAKLVDDSLAAVLGCREKVAGKNSVLVYSWGASTFCATLYRAVGKGFRVAIAPEGDRELGGDDVNSVLLDCVDKSLVPPCRIDYGKKSSGVIDELERVKRVLADERPARLSLVAMGFSASLSSNAKGEIEILPEVFVQTISPMVERTLALAQKVLTDGDCPLPDAVLVTGGMTRVPFVRRQLEGLFPGRIESVAAEAIAVGAVIHGRMLPAEEWRAAERRQGVGPARGIPDVCGAFSEPLQKGLSSDSSHEKDRSTWAATLDLEPLLAKAEVLERSGRLDEAVLALDAVHERLGKFSSLVYYRAASKHIESARSQAALPLLRRANRLDPTHQQAAWKYAKLCIEQSDVHLKQDRYREAWEFAYEAVDAIERLPDAERKYPQDLALCLHREACLLSGLGRLNEAESLLKRCMRLDPNKPVYQKDLGRIQQAMTKPQHGPEAQSGTASKKVGRNDPCTCGSGKKWKKCCGR